MISRNRSISTAAAMAIDRTTSANRTVTCLYSADRVASVSGEPHSLQNFAVAANCAPHDLHDSPAAASASLPSSTPVSCHRWSDTSAISQLGRCPTRFPRPRKALDCVHDLHPY